MQFTNMWYNMLSTSRRIYFEVSKSIHNDYRAFSRWSKLIHNDSRAFSRWSKRMWKRITKVNNNKNDEALEEDEEEEQEEQEENFDIDDYKQYFLAKV